jgi:integrase
MKAAEKIKSIREYEILVGSYQKNKQISNITFIKYMELLVAERGNYHKYVPSHFKTYLKKDVKITDVDVVTLEGFRKFLLKKYKSKTVQQYMTTLNITLNQALREELIQKNPLRQLKPLKVIESKREHLTYAELQSLYNTNCDKEQVKKAFLFACFCGLRISDIRKLRYRNIKNNIIELYQTKTKDLIYIPINKFAYNFIDVNEKDDEKVVFDLPSPNIVTSNLKNWVEDAGITKRVTFHVSRHTFATLQLSFGTDIYTVSKLLGHKNLQTTQVYAKIVDNTKVEAINRMPEL